MNNKKNILQEKKRESFECSGKKAKLKRLVVFRKTKQKRSYFGDSLEKKKRESVNKF